MKLWDCEGCEGCGSGVSRERMSRYPIAAYAAPTIPTTGPTYNARMDTYTLHRGTAPLLISLPHDGTAVPGDIAARLTDSARRVPDTDWHVSRLYGFARGLGVSM